MMVTRRISILIILLIILLQGCQTYRGINDLVPPEGEYSNDEIATLVVAYPMKPNTINGEAVEEVGSIDTIFQMLPGDYELTAHMDTSTHWSDSILTATYHDPFSGLTTYEPMVRTESSGVYSTQIHLEPGLLYFYRVILDDGSQFITGTTAGPNPFTAPNGNIITIDPVEDLITVDSNGSTTEYSLVSKYIYHSSDGLHIAFISYDKKKYVSVVDGVPGQKFDSLHKVGRALNADGSRFAFGIWIKRDSFNSDLYLAVNDDRDGPYQGIDPGAPLFFDINDNVNCSVKKNDVWHVKIGVDEYPMESKEMAAEKVWMALSNYYRQVSGEGL